MAAGLAAALAFLTYRESKRQADYTQGQVQEAQKQTYIQTSSNRARFFVKLNQGFFGPDNGQPWPVSCDEIPFGPNVNVITTEKLRFSLSGEIVNASNVPALLESGDVWLLIGGSLPQIPIYSMKWSNITAGDLPAVPLRIFQATSDIYDRSDPIRITMTLGCRNG